MQIKQFTQLMAELRGCYGLRPTDPDQWKATVLIYFKKLGQNQDDAIVSGFELAWREYPTFFPTAAEMLNAIKTAEKGLQHKTPPERQIAEPEAYSSDGAAQAKAIVDAIAGKVEA